MTDSLDSKSLYDLLESVTARVGRKIGIGHVEVREGIDQAHAFVLLNLVLTHALYINNIAIGLAAYRKIAQPKWLIDFIVGQDEDGIYVRIGLPSDIVGAVIGTNRQNVKQLSKLFAPLTTQTKPEWTIVEVLDRRQL